MDNIEFIKSLIDDLNKLPDLDRVKLDALQRRAKMAIINIFGEKSGYLEDLRKISFDPPFPLAVVDGIKYQNEFWDNGKTQLLNLFNTMLEDLSWKGRD